MKLLKSTALFLLLASSSVQAGMINVIDFTGNDWTGVGQNVTDEFTFGDIKLSSSGGNLTFNDSDSAGCTAASVLGLACIGDGIGISNDEITQGGGQVLTISFLGGPVDILDVHLLDLFATEQLSGEIAIINGTASAALDGSANAAGGYWATGLGFTGVTSITLSGNADKFSDYSLARIAYKVPEPTVISLFALGLLGLGFARRRKA
ncbi:MAG: PEP-CTERM sorting domain-containing protein [Gammaproteobacteria bacterium]|nr:PEP-CTERM sorting domain-containing protein [Gammaproteobacteria bacterium]